ncbi:MAG: P-type conjugative transfer protein TrbJ [Candidatus Eremiobacteraeota bacterium]|nr:P-type conjugative transfer protein TrbJ [Candidatus Eremiobacteraeota bacterium]
MALSTVSESRATLPVFDPINYVQNVLNQANTLKATTNQATQIANELRQIEMQAQALRNIPKGQWGQIRADLAQLQQIMQRSQTINYADQNLTGDFARMYPGFHSPTNYLQEYRGWVDNALGGIKASLQDADIQNRQLGSEDDVLQALRSMSDGASGHMQALQVGNMIAVQQVQQLQKLRQLQMAQIQAQAGFLATQQQGQSSQYASLKAWIDSANAPAVKF